MFITEPTLGILPSPDKWVVKSPGRWKSAALEFTLPVGFVSDLASIPKLLRNVLDVDGRSRFPALVHDWLYSGRWTSRAFADAQLRSALIEYGETPVDASIYWCGVRTFGGIYWARRNARGAGLQADDFIDVPTWSAARAMPPPLTHPASS